MKRTSLLHAELSHLIATLGHGDMVVIGDAGLPVPRDVQRIDLALMPGIPAMADVLKAVLTEMQVEQAVIATESVTGFAGALPPWCQLLEGTAIDQVPHATLKALTGQARAVVRSGECTPYANVILYAGVIF